MKWVDDTEPPQICTEIRSYDKKVTETYCVLDLPAMVITAEDEQVLDVLLEYDPLRTNSTFPATGRPRRRWPSPWNRRTTSIWNFESPPSGPRPARGRRTPNPPTVCSPCFV